MMNVRDMVCCWLLWKVLILGIGKYLVIVKGSGCGGSSGKVIGLRLFLMCWNSVLWMVLLKWICLDMIVWVILFSGVECSRMLILVICFELFVCMGIVLM